MTTITVCRECGFLIPTVGHVHYAACPACFDRELLARGGKILGHASSPPDALFPLGVIKVTPGAVAALGRSGDDLAEYLTRHARGDWGTFGKHREIGVTPEEFRGGCFATDDPGKLNTIALRNAGPYIMSEYRLASRSTLWIRTDLPVRVTTVMEPDDW